MSLTVDQPILNNPYREPTRYWVYENRQPTIWPGRRPAGYYIRNSHRPLDAPLAMDKDEHFVELALVNTIRKRVSEWRQRGYPGVTPVTRKLLAHWTREGRDRQLFFCQLEAAETIIWLTETEAGRAMARQVPLDLPNGGKGYPPLRRFGAKMATGSGKTVVMAMVIAWSVLNKVQAPQSRRYSDAVLVVCPNLTVKERLGGAPREVDGVEQDPARPLIPGARGNYYEAFDLVPAGMRDLLGRARVHITNWHGFMPEDDSRRRGIVQRGAESDAAFCARVLRDLGSRRNILVINDEAHHAYRPAPLPEDDDALADLSQEARAEREEATVWVSGLDRINAVRGINFCFDLSATPFYIQGSGYPEGEPFPWLVSDFGLVDAIESGIVKIPRVPVADDTGRPEPKYFSLWKTIMPSLSPRERGTARRKPKPEAVLREAEGALQQLAGVWKTTYEAFQRGDYPVPPCMIVVCDNTDIAKLVHEYIAEDGRVLPELLGNEPGREVTIRIDSKLLAQADLGGEGSRAAAAERLRRIVSTVGKPGEPGAEVRCVVSVGMLTEGWDAQNVTQILGLRAFQSQLLCEQVIGRGLRRLSYDFDLDENGIPQNEEYVDVYGIPFEVIPVKRRPTTAPVAPRETTLVQALKERETAYGIEFPRVEGYVFAVTDRIACDVAAVPQLKIDPNVEPTAAIVRAKVGYELGAPGLAGPGETQVQTREQFYASVRLQQIEYEIARRLTNALLDKAQFQYRARHLLFPQALEIVRAYLRRRVDYGTADPREIGLEKYVSVVVQRLGAAIRPVDAAGEAKLLPRLERFRPRGSTREVVFRTVRPCRTTVKSHISHVVLDTQTWEASVAYQLEMSPLVQAYARNDHLDLAIPYEFAGAQHDFLPDFVVRLVDGSHLLLEVKGMTTEEDRQKYTAAERWCEAVTNWGDMGRWIFRVCERPSDVPRILDEVASAIGRAA
ncbi:MAG: DEAD/DEAH box helicase family protein [Sphaerobacter sp.]|nr:DEAD/DEAH box helicase family protein [Sphaerobacter sp.]